MNVKNIGILTSGGDCAGLNAIIKGVATAAQSYNINPHLIPNGYAGLYNLIDLPQLLPLTKSRLEKFSTYDAGSEAGNSRVKIIKIDNPKKYERIKQGLQKFKLDALVIAGGDDTGSVVIDLCKQGLPCVHVPKTMDLDLIPYSVGGDSTINRIAELARNLRTTAYTHNRIMVMEVFGRYAGHTAFRGGVGAASDIILLPEIQVDFDLVYTHTIKLLSRRIEESDNQAGMVTIMVAEGIKDASGSEIVDKSVTPDSFGHYPLIGAGKYVVRELETRLKNDHDSSAKTLMKKSGQYISGLYEIPEVREVRPGHLVRCGSSSVIDISFGFEIGAGAVELMRAGTFGVTVTGLREGQLSYMDCKTAIQQRFVHPHDIALYERLGFCFGRKANTKWKVELKKTDSKALRPH